MTGISPSGKGSLASAMVSTPADFVTSIAMKMAPYATLVSPAMIARGSPRCSLTSFSMAARAA